MLLVVLLAVIPPSVSYSFGRYLLEIQMPYVLFVDTFQSDAVARCDKMNWKLFVSPYGDGGDGGLHLNVPSGQSGGSGISGM